ncbi:hypothetical protein FDP22_12640 [Paroceanicella profunda]|uniref:Uncharacterized protein n=1 Tax=Paroceanicella profunda TaxID=2579971 RepID=A0A5B8FVT5_9RHOB|nr:hypothetical protein [Paroceanicella profunda]QDL92555.1 hypothetical protein FDP22_12640 [Paroceanicella profunda]
MARIASPLEAAGDFSVATTDQIAETEDGKILTAAERVDIEQTKLAVAVEAALRKILDERTESINGRNDASVVISSPHPELDGKTLSNTYQTAEGGVFVGTDDLGVLYSMIHRVLGEFSVSGPTSLKGSVSSGNYTIEYSDTAEYSFVVRGFDGFIGFGLTRESSPKMEVPGGSKLGGQSDWSFGVQDEQGNVGLGIKDGIWHEPYHPLSPSEIARQDARNKDFSRRLRDANLSGFQIPWCEYMLTFVWGQSLARGVQTNPSISKDALPDTYMIGNTVNQNGGDGAYVVIGPTVLNPLVAQTNSGATILDGAGEAALSADSSLVGEPPVIGMVRGIKNFLNRKFFSASAGPKIIAINPSIGSKTLDEISKVPETPGALDIYGIMLDGMDKALALTGASTICVSTVGFMQGEGNLRNSVILPGDTGKTYYKAREWQLFDDIDADVMSRFGARGQTLPPIIVSYQTRAKGGFGDFAVGGEPGLPVPMAQLETCLERANTFMAGPSYPYNDKSTHYSSNGSRHQGHNLAKVSRRVLENGEDWQPLRPIEIRYRDNRVVVNFHVPVGPLRFDAPWGEGMQATFPVDRGFLVTDALGIAVNPIQSVEIVADTVIEIACRDTISQTDLVWYADSTFHDGNGNLCDSDPEVAYDRYEYIPERGMDPAENIPALIDKPYSLANWCVAFSYPMTYSEF